MKSNTTGKSTTTTEQSSPRAVSHAPKDRPALLVAFPWPCVLPLPPSGEVVGRGWIPSISRLEPDSQMSSRHFCIHRLQGGHTLIEDAGSRNGTWINGYRIMPGQKPALKDGDLIRVGRTLLVFRAGYAGKDQPEGDLHGLVGPYGLTHVRKVLDLLRNYPLQGRARLNVLIQGETGTGKELLARAVATVLERDRPYAPVNVAAIQSTVFEGQLFGWLRGAFSGSADGSQGIVKSHEGGSIFLDEIGELPLETQPKLLRLLENRDYLPVGGTKPQTANLLIIAATNRGLEDGNVFRQDLHQRFQVRIPLLSLRSRREDIFWIGMHLRKVQGFPALDVHGLDIECIERIILHSYDQGNIRELFRLFTHPETLGSFSNEIIENILGARRSVEISAPITRSLVEKTIAECGGNKSEAARRLQMSWGAIQRILKKES